jgi:hypothetical protein
MLFLYEQKVFCFLERKKGERTFFSKEQKTSTKEKEITKITNILARMIDIKG